MYSSDDWIRILNLQSHPEGGYFAESYRSQGLIPSASLPDIYSGDRHYATSIYFLITPDRFSSLHRLQSDEIWNFYDGVNAEILMIMPEGKLEREIVGKDPASGALLQTVVPAGCWFGSRLIKPTQDAFALVGCTVVPGFTYEDFELANPAELQKMYPQHRDIIGELTY